MNIQTKWAVAVLVILAICAGFIILFDTSKFSEDISQPQTKVVVKREEAPVPVPKVSQESESKNVAPVDAEEAPEPIPESSLPYCVNAFEEHFDVASEYVKQFDENPRVADDEFVVWRNSASGVGRCNNGNMQSTRFLFGYGEVLLDENGNPESYEGYLVVDGDSSNVTIFENCNEKTCEPTQWCTPIYGPSFCSDDECTSDEVFKGCK